jgi:hypothetical protein
MACRSVALVRYTGAVLNMLIATRWLDESEAHNRRQVGEALARMAADAAKDF